MPRLEVLKTYKVYIGGQFPRGESGHYYAVPLKDGTVTNICLCSRKDVRDAVVAARNALAGWSERTAFNRSQILYRIAEMLEGRKVQFVEELKQNGLSQTAAAKEVEQSIDRCVYWAGWCDKYTQVFGSVNPVASSHFNFSVHEPTGVVTTVAPDGPALLGLVSVILPAIAGGNTIVVLASETMPHSAVTFAEVLNSSDLPGGVVNIVTGAHQELAKPLAGHLDVDAVWSFSSTPLSAMIEAEAAGNIKRSWVNHGRSRDWFGAAGEGREFLRHATEVKTIWVPYGE